MVRQKVEVPIEESKSREDYRAKLLEAVGYYFNRSYACDLPIRRGTTIFAYQGREFDVLDYRSLTSVKGWTVEEQIK